MALNTHKIGNVPSKVAKALNLVTDKDIYPIDIIADCGLSTIYAASNQGTVQYDDEKYLDIDKLYRTTNTTDSITLIDSYKTVVNTFIQFAKEQKSLLFIGDILKHVFIQGKNKKTLTDKKKSFSKHIYWPIKHLTSTFNTSFGTMYSNWCSVYDDTVNRNVWVPSSGIISAIMVNSDKVSFPWVAPAGLTRGIVSNISDISYNYNQQQRGALYNININTIDDFSGAGYAVFGQKTLQAKPSAFDRINVRRLFLYLEKVTQQTVKHYVFEPNTYTTRSNVVNILTPIFQEAKTSTPQGIYDYRIVCDARNNTSDVVDQQELKIDIYIKPSRTAEFILVNFYATRTSQVFAELVS